MSYYTNSNEIKLHVDAICEVDLQPLETLDPESPPGDVILFDMLFYKLLADDEYWTETQLLTLRPEWQQQILPLLKTCQREVFLFTYDWFHVYYVKERQHFMVTRASPPVLDVEGTCLLTTSPLNFNMIKALSELLEPIRFGQQLANWTLSKLNKKVSFDVCCDYKGMCEKMKDLAISLDQEVTRWKDRFFFDAMDAEDEDLCEDCKESMRDAFYVNNDRNDALNWRPGQGNCVWRNCRYYKQDCMDSETM